MLKGKTAGPGAVWNSNKGLAADERAAKVLPPSAKRKRAAKLPDFIAPHLCESVERPPNGSGWAHEIKFDGYRLQLRTENGTVTLKTRKGLDWPAKFGAIAQAAA